MKTENFYAPQEPVFYPPRKEKTFMDFLKEKHGEIYSAILDDDLPDAFDAWLEGRTKEEIIEYAEEMLKN